MDMVDSPLLDIIDYGYPIIVVILLSIHHIKIPIKDYQQMNSRVAHSDIFIIMVNSAAIIVVPMNGRSFIYKKGKNLLQDLALVRRANPSIIIPPLTLIYN